MGAARQLGSGTQDRSAHGERGSQREKEKKETRKEKERAKDVSTMIDRFISLDLAVCLH